MVGGVVVTAIAVVAVAIAVSSGGNSAASVIKPDSPAAKKAQASVNSLLQGIPQHGNTLGSPSAKVTVTEFGDLECPVCKSFALGAENQLIANEVRSGKVKLVYRSLETASGQANGAMFIPQQAAALAAGQQKLGWNYIELFYHEQGDETSSYVNDGFLGGLAKQVSGLNFNQWSSDRQSSSFTEQVNKDTQAAAAQGFSATPTIVVSGPQEPGQADREPGDLPAAPVGDQVGVVNASARIRRGMLVLSVIGLGVAIYLTYVHYSGTKPACTAGESCIKVQTSQWSKLAGVPVALIGLIGYVSILASLVVGDREESRLATLGLTLIGFLFSGYLTYRELFSIHAVCEWCASSAVILTILLVCAVIRYVITDDLHAAAEVTAAPSQRATASRA